MFGQCEEKVREVIKHNYGNIAKYFGISDDFSSVKILALKDDLYKIEYINEILYVCVNKDGVKQRITYTVAEFNRQTKEKTILIVPVIQDIDGVFGYNHYDDSCNVILSQFVDTNGKCMASTTDQIDVKNIETILGILQQEFKKCIDGKVNEEVRVAYWLLSISLLNCNNHDIRQICDIKTSFEDINKFNDYVDDIKKNKGIWVCMVGFSNFTYKVHDGDRLKSEEYINKQYSHAFNVVVAGDKVILFDSSLASFIFEFQHSDKANCLVKLPTKLQDLYDSIHPISLVDYYGVQKGNYCRSWSLFMNINILKTISEVLRSNEQGAVENIVEFLNDNVDNIYLNTIFDISSVIDDRPVIKFSNIDNDKDYTKLQYADRDVYLLNEKFATQSKCVKYSVVNNIVNANVSKSIVDKPLITDETNGRVKDQRSKMLNNTSKEDGVCVIM